MMLAVYIVLAWVVYGFSWTGNVRTSNLLPLVVCAVVKMSILIFLLTKIIGEIKLILK